MTMEYKSTRGGIGVSFQDALLKGLAPDGGLYVPTSIPRIPYDYKEKGDLSGMSADVLLPWLQAEVERDHLLQIIKDALNFEVPLISLGGAGWEDVHVLELFHGPTLSFKDFGARTMARLMRYFLDRRNETRTILVATSGDTGSAVADGFAGQDRIDVVLLYPKDKVSNTQERQLIVERPGVRALAVEGDFDDCQQMVKEAFTNPNLSHLHLSSANSINVGRLLPQMVYYFWAVLKLQSSNVLFCVPSGNLGNLTAGILALLSGLRVRSFIAAHNANDFFPRFLSGEDAHFKPTVGTFSNAMDVGAPSNFERLRTLLETDQMRRLIHGESVTNTATIASIRRVYDATGYVADPHTAVGLEAVRRARTEGRGEGPAVVLATAHPAKFPQIIERAIGLRPDAPPRLAALWGQPVAFESAAPTQNALMHHLLR